MIAMIYDLRDQKLKTSFTEIQNNFDMVTIALYISARAKDPLICV